MTIPLKSNEQKYAQEVETSTSNENDVDVSSVTSTLIFFLN